MIFSKGSSATRDDPMPGLLKQFVYHPGQPKRAFTAFLRQMPTETTMQSGDFLKKSPLMEVET